MYTALSAKANLEASPIILHVSGLLGPSSEILYCSIIPSIWLIVNAPEEGGPIPHIS